MAMIVAEVSSDDFAKDKRFYQLHPEAYKCNLVNLCTYLACRRTPLTSRVGSSWIQIFVFKDLLGDSGTVRTDVVNSSVDSVTIVDIIKYI